MNKNEDEGNSPNNFEPTEYQSPIESIEEPGSDHGENFDDDGNWKLAVDK